MKTYKCECGREFNNAQKCNAHKGHCEVHLSLIGKLEQRQLINKKFTIGGLESNIRQKAISKAKHSEILNRWILEKHKCEHCNEIMTEKFGSGRFCSRSCANKRHHSEETKNKLRQKRSSYKLSDSAREGLKELNKVRAQLRKEKQLADLEKYNLPIIEDENKNKGYFSRNILSYAEKFWKQVLDNNNINYIHDYRVLKNDNTAGCYKLDFLIDNNIDLEIDGKQHKDSVEHDTKRTLYLESLGYRVYRIPWINPINLKNKEEVNAQIKDLFIFLNKPRIY